MTTSEPSTDRMLAYLADLNDIIQKVGWAVQGVFSTEPDGLGFAYTIGLHAAGLPELLISGGSQADMNMLLNMAGNDHLKEELRPGTLYHGRYLSLPMMPIKAPAAEIGFAKTLYGPTVKALQLIWPDRNGVWPGQPGHHQKARQEFFGTYPIPKEPPCPTRENPTTTTKD